MEAKRIRTKDSTSNTLATMTDLLASYAARLLNVETTLQQVLRENAELRQTLDAHLAQHPVVDPIIPLHDVDINNDKDNDEDEDSAYIVLGGTKRKRDEPGESVSDLLEQIGHDSEMGDRERYDSEIESSDESSSSIASVESINVRDQGHKRKAPFASSELFWALRDFPLDGKDIAVWWQKCGSLCNSLANACKVVDDTAAPVGIRSTFFKFLDIADIKEREYTQVARTWRIACSVCTNTITHTDFGKRKRHTEWCTLSQFNVEWSNHVANIEKEDRYLAFSLGLFEKSSKRICATHDDG